MGAVNDKHLGKYEGILEVAPYVPNLNDAVFVRFASVRNLKSEIDVDTNALQIKADDTKTIIDAFKPENTIPGTFLENVDASKMQLVLGGIKTVTSGTSTSVTAEAHGTGWTVGQPFRLDNQNGDNTEVSSIVVKKGTTTLVDGTDYETYVGDGNNGTLGATYITPLTVATTAITASYSYTPNASETHTLTQEWTEKPFLIARITSTRGDVSTLNKCTFSGKYSLGYNDIYEAGDIAGTDFIFKGDDGSTVSTKNITA